MNRLSALCSAAVAALSLAACATVGPDFAAPVAPAADGYAMAGDPISARVSLTPEARAAGPWWMAFNSAELDRVIRQALADSPSLDEADATLRRVQAQAAAERGQALPQADLSAGAQRERINTAAFGFSGFPSPTINLYSIGAAVNYDLDLFGGRRRGIEAAQARVDAQAQRADAAYLTLTGNIALEAIRIAALQRQIDVLEEVVADDRRLIEMVDRAEQAGAAAANDVSGGEAQLAQDQAAIPLVRRELSNARHRLALLVGRSPAEWSAPAFTLDQLVPPASIPVAIPSSLVRRRPDILAAEADLHAATAEIGVATAALYPDVRLTAGLTQSTTEPGDLFQYDSSGWNFGAALAAPLFNGGTLSARRRAAEEEARAADARYRQTVLSAFTQVADVLSDLAHNEESLAAQDRAVKAAEINLNDSQADYRLGGGALLAVIDAQRQLNRAKRERALAEGRRLESVVQLFTATAADWRVAPAQNAANAKTPKTPG